MKKPNQSKNQTSTSSTKNAEQRQQELMFKLQMFEQHINQIQQQIQAVEQGILEMDILKNGVGELKGKTGEEIMAQIGKGIFVKAKLISEDLIVDIGNKNLISKNIPKTIELISEQIEKLQMAKEELAENLKKANLEMNRLIGEFKKSVGHSCGENCECEEDCGDECECEKD